MNKIIISEVKMKQEYDKALYEFQLEVGCKNCIFSDPKASLGYPMCTHIHPELKINSSQPDEPSKICLTRRQIKKVR